MELREKLCSLNEEELYKLVDETQEFISNVKKDKKEVLEKIEELRKGSISDQMPNSSTP